jgi:hypothetical protein
MLIRRDRRPSEEINTTARNAISRDKFHHKFRV